METLYSAACPIDGDPEFLKYTAEHKFLPIVYPLYHDVLRQFRDRVSLLQGPQWTFDPGIERLFLPHLFAKLEEELQLTMVLELNVARVRGVLKGESPEKRFEDFCRSLYRTDVRLSIVREYSVLFGSLQLIATNWLDFSLELLTRLQNDWGLVRSSMKAAPEQPDLQSVTIASPDTHRGGRSVTILDFSNGFSLVYKPHSHALDVHFGELLAWINKEGFIAPFRIVQVIDRGCYGWSEFVTHMPCSNGDQVRRFYQRLGGCLAVFHIVRASDMHFENLIAAGEFPIPVDLETLFHNDAWFPNNNDPAVHAFNSSVMKVMLLPQPFFRSDVDEGIDMSALGAQSSKPFPFGFDVVWEGEGTDEMRLARRPTRRSMTAPNRPILDNEEVNPKEHIEDFLEGFRWVYHLISKVRSDQAFLTILLRFNEDETRFVARNTAAYAALLSECRHPDHLRNDVDRDRVLNRLWATAAQQSQAIQIIPAELYDLRRGDIPVFTGRPNSRDLWTSNGQRVPDFFEQPVMELVREAISRMSKQDLTRQETFIRTAFETLNEGISSPDSALAPHRLRCGASPGPIDLASAVGDLLCQHVLEDEYYASWIGTTPQGADGRETAFHPLDLDLYSGLSGCSLFLGYLAKVTGNRSYEQIAKKAVSLIKSHFDRGRAGVARFSGLGAFSGLGGIIYALAHLAVLWGDASLIDDAQTLAAEVPLLVNDDKTLDVIGGSAGMIVVLQVLNSISGNARLLEAAVLCGERLLSRQSAQGTGVGWETNIESSQPLTGFSHGAAGIAWALLKLAAWSGDSRFRQTAESAIAYERSTFMPMHNNWPDYRIWQGETASAPRYELAWCHGAPGIALARIDSLQFMDDSETREEIQIALSSTAKSKFGFNHCLCHGDLGILDILLHAARRMETISSPAIDGLTGQILTTIREVGCLCGAQTSLPPPGFMAGLSGVGYGLLRLALPERVPSVLILEAPVS